MLHNIRRRWILSAIGGVIILLSSSQAFAHGIDVTARHIDNAVVVDARFSNGKPAGNGIVSIFGPDDKLVATGTTGANGQYVWVVAKAPSYLRIEVDVGLGHVGTRILTSYDLAQSPDLAQHQEQTHSVTTRNAIIGVAVILALTLAGIVCLRKRENRGSEADINAPS